MYKCDLTSLALQDLTAETAECCAEERQRAALCGGRLCCRIEEVGSFKFVCWSLCPAQTRPIRKTQFICRRHDKGRLQIWKTSIDKKGVYILEAITNKQRYTWKLAKQ